MTLKFDNELLKHISLFREVTNVEAVDCILGDDRVFFVVEKGKVGLAVGKNGRNVKKLEKLINKNIVVLELTEDVIKFLKSLLKLVGVKDVEFEKRDKEIIIKANRIKKGRIIGKGGSNIKLIRKLLKRHFDLEDIRLR